MDVGYKVVSVSDPVDEDGVVLVELVPHYDDDVPAVVTDGWIRFKAPGEAFEVDQIVTVTLP